MQGKKFSRREFLRLSAMTAAGLAVVSRYEPIAAAPLAQDKIEVTAWFADRRTINVMTEEVMKAEFEVQNPDLAVEVMFVPESEIPAKMATAYAAGQAPDITALDETQLPGFLKQEFIHPIPDEVLDVPQKMGKRIGDFYKIPPGPSYYAVPNGNMPCVVFYNADLLDELGYKPEDIPAQWDDFIEWAKEVTVWEGDEITQWGFTFTGTPWFWDSVAYQKGGWLFKNSAESMLDDPINVEAYQFVVDLLDVHKLDFRTAPLTPQDRVGQGLAVTGVQFGFGFGFLENQYPDTNFGTIPLPTFTGEPLYGRASDDLGFCVTTQKEEPDEVEAVWTLYRYLVGPDYQRRYVVLRGLQPSLLELNKEEQFTEDNPKWRGVALTTKPGGFHADGVWPAEVTPLMHQEPWERIVNQGEAIETVLADHKAKIDKILAEMDLPLLNGKEGWKAEWEEPEA